MQIETDEEQLKALYRNYWRCMIEKDADGLLEIMADEYRKEGYSDANAEARVCQDIVLKAISESNLSRNVMIGSSSSRFTHILSLNGRSILSQLAESNVER